MKKRKLWFIGSLIVFVTAAVLLITGSSVLTLSLSQKANIPLGTFITWFGIISLPLCFYYGIRRLREPGTSVDKYFGLLLKGLMGLAILWMPICFLLAGNMSFTFTEKAEFQGGQLAMRIFWFFSYFMVAGPIAFAAIFGIASLFRKK